MAVVTFTCQVDGPYRLDMDPSQEVKGQLVSDENRSNGHCKAGEELTEEIMVGRAGFVAGRIEVRVLVIQDCGNFMGRERTVVYVR